MLVSKSRVNLFLSLRDWFDKALTGFQLVPIDVEIAAISSTLQMHGDPADRLILATAIHTGTCLVTRDRELLALASRHGVPVLEA